MLEIKNLSYSVDENGVKKEILKNINLSFSDDKLYVITGNNGSGKSTLLKIIMGIEKQNEGDVLYNKKSLTNMSITERAKEGVSIAFQKPVTFKGLKVKDLLDITAGKSHNLSAMCEILSKVGLCAKDYIDRELDERLSGGEIKRIELAMALSRNAKISLFDEPEAGIDLWSFDNLTQIFSNNKNKINIVVSHQKQILSIADEIILLKNGEVVCKGEKGKVLPLLDGNGCGRLRGEQNG